MENLTTLTVTDLSNFVDVQSKIVQRCREIILWRKAKSQGTLLQDTQELYPLWDYVTIQDNEVIIKFYPTWATEESDKVPYIFTFHELISNDWQKDYLEAVEQFKRIDENNRKIKAYKAKVELQTKYKAFQEIHNAGTNKSPV